MTRRVPALFPLLFAIVVVRAQNADTKELPSEIFREFQFNFATPGARASGMGRAFIGLADDATAAVTNPAGLINLTKPQVYFEFKHSDLRSRRFSDRASLNTLETSTFYSDVDRLSFINFAYPLTDRVTIAFGRNEFLNYKERFVLGDRALQGDCTDRNRNGVFEGGASGECIPSLFAVRQLGNRAASIDFEGVSVYSGSIAFQINDNLSVGLTVSADRLKVNVESADFVGYAAKPEVDENGNLVFPPGVTMAGLTPDLNVSRYSINDSDTGISFTVGALYKLGDNLSVGGVFARGASFEVEQTRTFSREFVDFAQNLGVRVGDQFFSQSIPFEVPDRFGGGVAARPNERVLLLMDVLRIRYSDFLGGNIVFPPEAAFEGLGDSPSRLAAAGRPADYKIDDATEFHFGGEVDIGNARVPVFLRGGVFNNPNHAVRFTGDPTDRLNIGSFNLQDRNSGLGWTAGGGIVYKRFQADVAYLSTRSLDELVASMAVRF